MLFKDLPIVPFQVVCICEGGSFRTWCTFKHGVGRFGGLKVFRVDAIQGTDDEDGAKAFLSIWLWPVSD